MKGNRSRSARSRSCPPPGGLGGSISGVSDPHMSPAEKAALRAAGEDSFANIEQGYDDESRERTERAGGGARPETEDKEPSKQNVRCVQYVSVFFWGGVNEDETYVASCVFVVCFLGGSTTFVIFRKHTCNLRRLLRHSGRRMC